MRGFLQSWIHLQAISFSRVGESIRLMVNSDLDPTTMYLML